MMSTPQITFFTSDKAATNINELLDRMVVFDDGTVVIRKLIISDLKELIDGLTTSETPVKWKDLIVLSDEISVNSLKGAHNQMNIDLEDRNSVTIISRKFINTGSEYVYFTKFHKEGVKKLNIQIQEYQGPSMALSFRRDLIDLPLAEGEISISTDIGIDTPTFASFSRPGADWKGEDDLSYTMSSIFQQAIQNVSTSPELSINMFRWVYKNTKTKIDDHPEYRNYALQSSSMVLRLQKTTNAYYIPILSHEEYAKKIANWTTYAGQIEQSFNRFIDVSRSYADRQNDVKNSIADSDAQKHMVEQSILDVKVKLEAAENNLSTLTFLADEQSKVVERARIDLQAAIETKVNAAAFNTVCDLVKDIGAIAAGGEIQAIGAIGKIEDLEELIEKLKGLLELMDKVKKIADGINDVYSYATSDESGMPSLTDEINNGDMLADYDWEVLKNTLDIELGPYATGSDKVDGGIAYLNSLHSLIIYCQSTSSATKVISDLQGKIISLRLKADMYAAQKTRLQAYITGTVEEQENFRECATLMQQRYLDVKRGLLGVIMDFNDAYRYWALRHTQLVTLSSNSSMSEIGKLTADVQDKIDAGLVALFVKKDPPVVCRVSFPIGKEEKASLINGEKLWIPVKLTDVGLQGWSRVRIHDIEIYLPGLPDGVWYHFDIKSSGKFQDRYDDENWMFIASESQEYPFEHQASSLKPVLSDPSNHIWNDLTISGDEGGLDSGALYYRPTLFSDWSIRLKKGYRDIDLSGVDRIQLIFRGRAMSANNKSDQ